MGQTLGKQLVKNGRSVCYGSRNPKALQQELGSKGLAADALSVHEAVIRSDILILAVPGWRDAAGVAALADSLGPDVAGKVLVDATNPLSAFPDLEVLWNGTSGGELLAAGIPSAHVYKAFNTIGTTVMEAVEDMGYPVQLMYAGPSDAEPKALVDELIRDTGFEPTYLGPIRYARNLEAIAELWIHLGVPPAGFTKEHYGRLFSFQLQQQSTK